MFLSRSLSALRAAAPAAALCVCRIAFAAQTPPAATGSNPPAVAAPQAASAPPHAVVLGGGRAMAWLSAAGIRAVAAAEADIAPALNNAALCVVPLNEVTRPATVDALKSFAASGGRIIGANWGQFNGKWAPASGVSSLFGISVTGWSARGNAAMTPTPAGKALFGSQARLATSTPYAVVASAPGAATNTPPRNAATNSTASVSAPAPANIIVARWTTEDGRPSRPAPNDVAIVQSPAGLWIGAALFDDANEAPELRRWFQTAAVAIAPALKPGARQAIVERLTSGLAAAKSVLDEAVSIGADANLPDAQTRYAAAERAVQAAATEQDFALLLKAADNIEGAFVDIAAYCTPSRPVEARAVWLEESSIPKTAADIAKLVTRFAEARFNVIYPETVYRGRAIFPSKVYTQDENRQGSDSLRLLIEEAHKRGIEVHPWIWTLCAGYYGEQGPLLRSHPEWAARDKAGRTVTDGNGLLWLSPSVPEARTAIRNVIREITARYDIDGIHLDYVRYDSPWMDYSDAARAAFLARTGDDPLTLGTTSAGYAKWHEWREEQVTSLVAEIRSDLRSVKPSIPVSAAVSGTVEDARRERLQNWGYLAANRLLDFVAPVFAVSDGQALDQAFASVAASTDGGSLLAPGVAVAALPDARSLIAAVGRARARGAQGICLFSGAALTDEMLRGLKLGPFRLPAVLPWKDLSGATRRLATDAARKLRALAAGAPMTTPMQNALAALDSFIATAPGLSLPPVPDALRDPEFDQPRFADARATLEAARRVATLITPLDEPIPATPAPLPHIAEPLPLPTARVPVAAGLFTVDGRLDDPVWKDAAVLKIERTHTGGYAPVATTVRVARDTSGLLISFDCTEPRLEGLRASITGRDVPVQSDDSVEVFLSPEPAGLPWYQFAAGAGGGFSDARTGDIRWSTRWQCATGRSDTGWTAEMYIPFSSLNTDAPASGSTWLANITRNRLADTPSYLNWSVTYGTFLNPDRFGKWTF